jgi:hypothetical protein
MGQRVERTNSISLPRGSGVEPLLLAVKTFLQYSGVQSITIERGRIGCTRLVAEESVEKEPQLDLGTTMPYAIVRNAGNIVSVPHQNGQDVLAVLYQLFRRAAQDRVVTLCWVGSNNSAVWHWLDRQNLAWPTTEELQGLPFYQDAEVEDQALLLCCGERFGGTLIDMTVAYVVQLQEPA